ncbi:DUF1622 domain-containing protein [Polycladidibacter stylochi]|uniref:DUF1622 domain-containing protein n=1 Tax=Polycladidibacter stylochi TaxID=1807766 RepID=UPI0008362853|nr:DUF1622 domain-containing protein [Pseudovibrio stylochi]
MSLPFSQALEYLTILIDFIGYIILMVTAGKFVLQYVKFELHRLSGLSCALAYQNMRMEFLSQVILAIDFMVISDVIKSGLAKDLNTLITLAVFVLIRSALAFFLGLDLKQVQQEHITKSENLSSHN